MGIQDYVAQFSVNSFEELVEKAREDEQLAAKILEELRKSAKAFAPSTSSNFDVYDQNGSRQDVVAMMHPGTAIALGSAGLGLAAGAVAAYIIYQNWDSIEAAFE